MRRTLSLPTSRPPPRSRRLLGVALTAALLGGLLPGPGPVERGGAASPGTGRAWADDALAARRGRVVAGLGASDPARRRAALGELLAAARQDEGLGAPVLPALKEVLRLRDAGERAQAARALLALHGPEAEGLWLRLLADPVEDERVLLAAVESAAERAGDAALARTLVERSSDPRQTPAARGLALEALGALGGPAADLRLALVGPQAGWLEESCRALGLARRAGLEAVPALIALLHHADAAPRVHAWEGLVRLTGRSLPVEAAPWEAWWKARGTAPPALAGGPSAASEPHDRYAAPASQHVPRYYGVPVPRRGAEQHVVFCIDVSQSMYGPPLERSKKELQKTLHELPSTARFEVVAFNENALPFAGRLVRAHPVMKARAGEWFLALEPTSYTNLYDALEIAFGLAGRGRRAVEPAERLDAIFVLSDGEPNRGRYREPGPIVKAVAELSRPDLPVHTIGAGEAAFSLLRRLAQATGGTFTDAFE